MEETLIEDLNPSEDFWTSSKLVPWFITFIVLDIFRSFSM